MNERMSFIGTQLQAIDIVPTKVLSMMSNQNRPKDYIFRATVDLGYVLVW